MRALQDPMNTTGLAVLGAVLAVTTVAGFALRARAGRVRAPRDAPAADGWALAGRTRADGHRVLLLQLSSPVCAPCRQTAALLADLAARTPAIAHHEIDVAHAPGVARTLGVLRTPTVVAFDRAGAELLRVAGVPRRGELEAALAPALESA